MSGAAPAAPGPVEGDRSSIGRVDLAPALGEATMMARKKRSPDGDRFGIVSGNRASRRGVCDVGNGRSRQVVPSGAGRSSKRDTRHTDLP